MLLFSDPTAHPIGIDLSDNVFRLVEIRRDRVRRKLKLHRYTEERVAPGIIAGGEFLDRKAALEHLRALVKNAYGRAGGRGVIASLPETKTFIKVIKAVCPSDVLAVERAILAEAELHIPSPLSELSVDWRLLAPKKELLPGKTVKAVIAAAPKKVVEDYALLFEEAGLAPVAFEIEAQAIARSILPAAPDDGETAVGIVDFGATRSSFIVFHRGTIQFTVSIPLSGNEVTRRIAQDLGVPFEEAERAKRQCGVDAHKCGLKMWGTMQPFLAEMTQRITDAVAFYRDHFEDGKMLDEIVMCGGGANMLRIDELLSELVKTKVRRADPWTNIDPNRCPLPKEIILSSTTAVGLALRAALETNVVGDGL